MSSLTKLKRRAFIGTGLLSTGAILINPLNLQGSNHPFAFLTNFTGEQVFMSESGMLGKDDVFVVGVLTINGSVEKHEKALEAIKQKHNYRAQLTYKSNNRFKVPVAKDMITYFVNNSDLAFMATMLNNGSSLPRKGSSYQSVLKKIAVYEDLLVGIDKKEVIVKSQSPFGPSRDFKSNFKEKTNTTLVAMDARKSNLLQFSDLLTGCIRGDKMKVVRNPEKASIVSHLKKELGVSSVGEAINLSNKFVIKK